MADAIFTQSKLGLIQGQSTAGDNFDWNDGSQTVRLLLLKNTYTYDATDKYVSDLTPASNEVSGTGYARKDITGRSSAVSGTQVLCDATDPSTYTGANGWTSLYAALYRYGTGDADSPLIAFFDCSVTANGGDITIQFSSSPSAAFTVG